MSTPLAKDDKGKVVVETNALNLRWTFGFNTSIPNTVHSLSTPQRHALFYVSSHTGVIHDVDHDVQQLLQGHIHPITAVCISHDKRWIATADSGKTDSMIIVWDANKAAPVKIIPQQESHGGIAAMDMSNDALFLVTLSQSYPQQLSIWEWTITTTTPTITTSVGDHEYQHCIRFNPVDVRDIVTNGQKQVIFWNWTDQALAAFHPPRGITKLKKSISSLTQTTFIPYTTKAVTATSSGHVILWDYPVSELVQSTGRDAIKVLKIVKAPINLIDTVLDKYLVCACGDAVRFFDFQFRVVAWFEDIIAGTVTSISFAHGMNGENKGTTVNNGIVSMDDFFVPDFVVGTAHGKILQLDTRTMDQLTPEKRRGRLFVQGFDDHVHALDAHPNLPLFVVGTRSGALQIWDIDERKISASRSFTAQDMIHENKHTSDTCDIRVVKYGPRGILLALGFANGMVKIVASHETNVTDTTLTTTPLRDIASFRRSTSAITHIAWSSDGQYMATADADMCVGLYRYYHRDEDIEKPMEWIDVGKYRSHYKTIISLYFESGTRRLAEAEEEARRAELEAHTKPHVEEKEPEKRTIVKKGKRLPTRGKTAPTTATRGASYAPRLFSLGEDRILQEYDLITSNIRSGITLATSTRMEQCAIPTAMMAMAGRPIKRSGEDKKEGDKVEYSPDLLITANDEYKLKVWQLKTPNKSGDPDDEPDKICRKTLLAPTYGGPINKLMILPKREGSRIIPSQFLIYSTAEKIVGLIKLPLDGNPNKSMALIAHPAEISCCVCSFDGRYLITAGGGDRCVNLWSISTNALEASIALSGGTGMEPYMSLMEGGKDGAFYQEMLDYFYYAQLRSQGVNTTGPRKIPGLIPLREVIHVMRALGFYPTEQQIADIHTEIRYAHSHYTRVADRELVNLEELIKLYVNHRPVHGLRKEELEGAFHLLQKLSNTESTDDIPHTSMSPHELIQQLTTLGEKMSISELEKCLESLVGEVKDDGGNPLLARLPSDIDATSFASDILGFTPESQS